MLFSLLQYFVLTSKGELKSEDNCLDYNGSDLYLRECDGLKQNQKWLYKVRGPEVGFIAVEAICSLLGWVGRDEKLMQSAAKGKTFMTGGMKVM